MYIKAHDGSPDEYFYYFTRQGDWRNIKLTVKKGTDHWNWGICGAVHGGHFEFAKFFTKKIHSKIQSIGPTRIIELLKWSVRTCKIF